MTILVTGGAGYIGSHTCVELLNAGYEVVVVDNLSNSSEEALRRVEEITGKTLTFYEVDILDRGKMERIFGAHQIDGVIHFAGYKAVGESVSKPWEYYYNNITGTLILCDVMRTHGVKKLVFSSSATVYGNPATVIEDILRDMSFADPEWNIVLLRYFNPIGAHKSGRIGENPKGIPNNLMPYITQVAIGKLPFLGVFGDDYDTPDGTGVRDYIHVTDLALGHVKAIEKMNREQGGIFTYNLGTGTGYSVLDIVRAFSKASGVEIPYHIKPRRPGDVPACYADPSKAREELGWTAQRGLEEMCEDSWRWQKNNPNGYEE